MRDRQNGQAKPDNGQNQANRNGKPNGRARPRQQQGGKRASFPWINSQIIAASESGGLPNLMATIMAHLPQMNLVNLSTAVHRVAKMSSNDMEAQAQLRHNPVFEELLRTIAGSLSMIDASEAQPQSLSNVAWSLATMRLMHRPLVQVVSALAVTNISCFKPFELSTMLWALAKLSSIDSSTWCMKPVFQASATHIMNHIAEFGFRCLATTAWAFATARQRHARLFRCIGAHMVPMAHVANCQEIANTSWAFGTADFHDDLLFTELAEKAMRRLDEFKPQELSNMLWGFATNGFFHEAFFTHASVVTQHMELQAQHLANILWAFVRVRPRHPVTLATILALLPSCTRQLESFKPQEVSSTALAVAKAYGIGDELDRPCAPNTLPNQFGTHFSHGALPRQVKEFFHCAMPWAVPRLHEFSAQSLANTVSAFAMARTPGDTTLFSAVGHEVVRRFDHLEPTALLHLLKGFSGAPRDSCDQVSKMLASAVAQHVETFRPQELQTLSRICMAVSGVRRNRDFTCDELKSCCLSYALGTEVLAIGLFDEDDSTSPAARCIEFAMEDDLGIEVGLAADLDFPPVTGKRNNGKGGAHLGLGNFPHLGGMSAPAGMHHGYDAQGMPPGALFESDFATSGPPVVNGLLRLSDSIDHIPLPKQLTNENYWLHGATFFNQSGYDHQHGGHQLRNGNRQDYRNGNGNGRSASPDNIGMRSQAQPSQSSSASVNQPRDKTKAIRNQKVPVWPQEYGNMTSINENAHTYVDPSTGHPYPALAGLPLSPPLSVFANPLQAHLQMPPAPFPSFGEIDTQYAEGGGENLQWRCSMKNSFLHFHDPFGSTENNQQQEEEQQWEDDGMVNGRDGGSSVRSSSVPSRHNVDYDQQTTPRHHQQSQPADRGHHHHQEHWQQQTEESGGIDGPEFLWNPKPLPGQSGGPPREEDEEVQVQGESSVLAGTIDAAAGEILERLDL